MFPMPKKFDVNAFVKKLQDIHDRNVEKFKQKFSKTKDEETQSKDRYIMTALIEAEKMWLNTQIFMKVKAEDYKQMKDVDKINMIRKSFTEFYDEFPVVSRYMICLGQYDRRAFEKMLRKCKYQTMDGTNNEDIWVQRQADYVKYLWQENQTHHPSEKEANEVWNNAYKALSKEFKQFRNMYDDAEKKIKKDDAKYKAELIRELIGRVVSDKQKLDDDEIERLRIKLLDKLYKQRYENVIKQIEELPVIEATCQGVGQNKYARQQHDEEMQQFELRKKYKKMSLA